jgi:transcriptional regulator with XRE-family HTH domain
MEVSKMLFGDYIREKRKERNLTLLEIAEAMNPKITPVYLSDIEKNRRNPPEKAMLDQFSTILRLTDSEHHEMMDLAGAARNQVSPDLQSYIMDTPEARVALRKARDQGQSGIFWKTVTDKLDKNDDEDS